MQTATAHEKPLNFKRAESSQHQGTLNNDTESGSNLNYAHPPIPPHSGRAKKLGPQGFGLRAQGVCARSSPGTGPTPATEPPRASEVVGPQLFVCWP